MTSTLNGLSYTKASIWPTCLGTDDIDNSDRADDSHVVRSGNIWRKGTQTRCSDHLPSEADQQPPDDDAGGLGSITFDIAQAIQEEMSTVDDGDPFRMMSPSTGNLRTATLDYIKSLKEQRRSVDAAALESAVNSIPWDSQHAHSLCSRLKNWAASRDFSEAGRMRRVGWAEGTVAPQRVGSKTCSARSTCSNNTVFEDDETVEQVMMDGNGGFPFHLDCFTAAGGTHA